MSSEALKNIFKNSITVKTGVAATIEYNMNLMLDEIDVTSTIADTVYTDQISNWPSTRPNPFKKLFPVDSVVKAFRPLNSGVKYFIMVPSDTTVNSFSGFKTLQYPNTQPRIYYPGISTVYKYWVTPVNSNVDLTVNYVKTGTKYAVTNKIVISFEKYHTLPSTYTVVITKSDDSTVTVGPYAPSSDGHAALYYNGTSWSNTAPSEPVSYADPILIKSIHLTAANPGGIVGVIEISARWIKDISSDIVTFNITKESSSSQTDILPVGNVTSNSLTLEVVKYDQEFIKVKSYNRADASIDSNLTYMVKNAEIKPYILVYHADGAITSGSIKYDKVSQGTYFLDTSDISIYGEITINALDGSKYLMETIAPQILCEAYPVTAILRRLLDSIGFTNYTFNINTNDTSIPFINYFWTDGNQTVWQSIQDLCRDIQMNAYFDDDNVLQFYSRDYMYGRTDVNWQFFYGDDGDTQLPNIIDFSQQDVASANQVKVLWKTPIASQYVGASTDLWKSPITFLSAGGLGADILESQSAEDTSLKLNTNTVEDYSGYQSLFNFAGYLLIDSEIIEYEAIQYKYTPKDNSADQTVWVYNSSDLNKYYYLSKPGYSDPKLPSQTAYIKPTGFYKVKTRGALGTTKANHFAVPENKLTDWYAREVVWN